MKNPRRTNPGYHTPYPISAARIRMQVICAVLIPATPLLTLHREGLDDRQRCGSLLPEPHLSVSHHAANFLSRLTSHHSILQLQRLSRSRCFRARRRVSRSRWRQTYKVFVSAALANTFLALTPTNATSKTPVRNPPVRGVGRTVPAPRPLVRSS